MILFKPIPEYPHLEISQCGTVVRQIDTGKAISIHLTGDGYAAFRDPLTGKQPYIHRCVLSAHVRPPRAREIARHLDDNRADNHVTNLAWGTHRDNAIDARINGRTAAQLHPRVQALAPGISSVTAAIKDPEQIRDIRRQYWLDGATQPELAALYGVSQRTIGRLVMWRTYQEITQEQEVEQFRAQALAKPKGHARGPAHQSAQVGERA